MHKKTTFYICCIIMCICSGTTFAQKKVTLKLQNATLQQFINSVESKTDYTFMYDNTIDLSGKVSVSEKDISVEDLLSKVFAGSNIKYLISGNQIILKIAKGTEPSQERIPYNKKFVVRGVVRDHNKNPLIGVSVITKTKTPRGTTTGLDGSFKIEANVGDILEFRYVGYVPQEQKVSGVTMNVVLAEADNVLDNVIVIGYGSITQKEMTSAISHISSKDFLNPSSLDASMLIQGKVSGLSVSNIGMGDPSRQASLQVRGIASRNATSSPLIIIDGVPGSNLTNVNPEDIESFDVLKDGAASAIYGTQGGHGVIIVTTKKGSKDGSVHTSISSSVTITQPRKELDVLTPVQFRAYRTNDNPILDRGGATDWFKAITRTALTHKHTFSISGGNLDNNFRVSADFRNAEGIDIRSYRKEYGGRASINHKTKGGLFDFSANIAPRIIERDKSDWGTFKVALSANPTMDIYDKENNRYTDFYGFPGGANPVETLKLDESSSEILMLDWDGMARLNLLPLLAEGASNYSLSTQIIFGQSHTEKKEYWFRPSTSNQARHRGYNGEASVEQAKSSRTNFDWLLNFSANLKKHSLKFVAGYNYQYIVASTLSGKNNDFASDALKWNNLGSGEWLAALAGRTGVGSSKHDNTLIGVFGRINYDYDKKYLMSASFRYEGSSKFGKNKKWGSFPAVSVGWRISQESFMKNIKWIDELKIRADYGVTGNSNIANYLSLSTYRAFGQYQYNGEWFNVWGPQKNVNSQIHWEEGHNKNIGIDFRLFNNLITGSVNYYHRNQKDLLGTFDVPVPPYLFGTTVVNVGTLKNNGVEIDLTLNLVNRKNFRYSTTIIGATNNNKFTSFSNNLYQSKDYYSPFNMTNPGNPGPLQEIRVGQRIGTYVTFRYAGVDENGDWLIWNSDMTEKIHHSKGSDKDKKITGNGLPKFTGSWSHNFSYKNWDASIFLRGAFGFDLFNVHDFYWGLQSMEGNVLKKAYAENAHITSGKNVVSDYFIEKGDYFKIDAISLGYKLPLKKKYIESIRFFSTINNIYTLTKFSGIDPSTYEVNGITPGTFGGDNYYYPSVRQFIFGIQIGF